MGIEDVQNQSNKIQDVAQNPKNEENQLNPRKILLKSRKVYIIIAFSLIFLIALFYMYVSIRDQNGSDYYDNQKIETEVVTTLPPTTYNNMENDKINYEYALEGGNVYRISEAGKKELFIQNIPPSVKEIRVGPDNKSLHFNMSPHDFEQYTCMSLTEKYDKASENYQNPPPNEPPWDFPRIGHAYTVKGCSFDKTSGFIPSTSYFVYLESLDSKNYQLVIEKSDEIQKMIVDLENQVVGTNQDYTYSRSGLSQVIANDDILLLDFGVIVFVSLSDGKIIGTYDYSQNFGPYGYQLITKDKLPLVLLGFQFEGEPSLSKLLDVSGESLVSTDLRKIGTTFYNDIVSIPRYEWESDGIIINFVDVDVITDEGLPKEQDYYLSLSDEVIIKSEEEVAVKKLLESGDYQNVVCRLDKKYWGFQGATFGCYGVKSIDKYRYTLGGNFTKID
ncbi:hypothetical protein K0B04_01260 [Patescibacteria group bacterium]|nr:hypothetical protein [Patescibacteria group bacterium]